MSLAPSRVMSHVGGPRGESFADVARRIHAPGLLAGATDLAAMRYALNDLVVSDPQGAFAGIAAAGAAATAGAATATSQAAVGVAAAMAAATSRDIVTQFAGIAATYASKAAADAAVGSTTANAFVMVLADEGRNGRRAIYQKQSGALVFIRLGSDMSPNHFVVFQPIASAFKAAYAAAAAGGGGTVILPSGVVDMIPVGSHPLVSGVSIDGVRPLLRWTLGQPDDGNAFEGGTIFRGDGTFDCFVGNNVDQATVPADNNQTSIKNVRLSNLGFDNFRHGIWTGAKNRNGIWQSVLEDLYFKRCNGWAMWLDNSFHVRLTRIYGSSGVKNGLWFRHYSTGTTQPWNSIITDVFFDMGGDLTSRGIVFESDAKLAGNELHCGRLQCNVFNRFSGPVVQPATMANGSATIGVTNASQYPVGAIVTVSATANGFRQDQLYAVLSRDTAANTLTLGHQRKSTWNETELRWNDAPAIAATGNGALNIVFRGMPGLELINVVNSKFPQCDIEGPCNVNIYMERTATSSVHNSVEAGSTNSFCLRSSGYNHISDYHVEGRVDLDEKSAATCWYQGELNAIRQHAPRGMYVDGTRDKGQIGGLRLGGSFGRSLGAGFDLFTGLVGSLPILRSEIARAERISNAPFNGSFNGTHLGYKAVAPTNGFPMPLPEITNEFYYNTLVGISFNYVNSSATRSAAVSAPANQPFNGPNSGKTLVVVPPGASAKFTAMRDDAGAFWWVVEADGRCDTISASGAGYSSDIPVGASRVVAMAVPNLPNGHGFTPGMTATVDTSVFLDGVMVTGRIQEVTNGTPVIRVTYMNVSGAAITSLPAHTVTATVRKP